MNTIWEGVIAFLLAAVIGLGIVCWLQHSTINDLQSKIVTDAAQKASCVTANTEMSGEAQAQNKTINGIVIDDQKRDAAAATAVKTSDAARQQDNTKAASVLAQPVNQNDCAGAQQVLKSYLSRGK
jgi:hypothetical protein